MSTPTDQQPRMRKEPVSGFSPTPGCLIMICGLLTVIGFLIWSGYTLVKQSGQIDTFTSKTAIEIVPLVVSNEARVTLTSKLKTFQDAVKQKQSAELDLSAEELNILLTLKPFSEVNTMIRIDRIDSEAIHSQISFTLNALPPGNVRYLNGTLSFEPAVNDKIGLVLNTKDIQVPDKVVAEGFLRRYKQDGYLDTMLVQEFRDEDQDPELAEILKAITSAKIVGDKVVIQYEPATPR